MEIKVDELHTYLHCPLKYKFKYQDQLVTTDPMYVLFKKAVHRTISFFFFSTMNGILPKASQMKDKWAATWEELAGDGVRGIQDILTISTSLHNKIKNGTKKDPEVEKYRILGFEMIHNFYSFNKDNPGNVIGVDLDYRVPIGNVTILGKFELIREIVDASDGKRYIEIVDFKTNSEEVDPFLMKNDLNLTLASYAFRNLFQDAKEDRVKFHYMKNGRDIIIVKQKQDYDRMKAIVAGVCQGIENKAFYPRQTFMCKACEYKEVCDRVRF